MDATAYPQDDFLKQTVEGAKQLKRVALGFTGGFAFALSARVLLRAALEETREESVDPMEWRPTKAEHPWPGDLQGQIAVLERYVDADVDMRRFYKKEISDVLSMVFPSFRFFAWLLGVRHVLDQWFDERMDNLLGMIAVRRAQLGCNERGVSADYLRSRLG